MTSLSLHGLQIVDRSRIGAVSPITTSATALQLAEGLAAQALKEYDLAKVNLRNAEDAWKDSTIAFAKILWRSEQPVQSKKRPDRERADSTLDTNCMKVRACFNRMDVARKDADTELWRVAHVAHDARTTAKHVRQWFRDDSSSSDARETTEQADNWTQAVSDK
ncbi:hypothetical protein LTR85_012034 [Meristemomyces frigidus]|nr:hypothetical protein LTR85_012034 [Meristemomyces frigidus]